MSDGRVTLRAYTGGDAFVFVSYAHADEARVYPLLAMLARDGVNVWFDEGISPGTPWRDELADAIDRCGLFLYLLTPASATSRNCQRECGYALDGDKRVLAVHLEETVLPQGLSLSLADQQAILAHRYAPALFERKLLDAVRRLLELPAADPAARAGRNRRRVSATAAALRSMLRMRPATMLALLAAVTLGTAAGWWSRAELVRRVPPVIVEAKRLTDSVGLEEAPALAPNGDTIAFVATSGGRRQVWVRLVAGGTPIAVTSTDADSYAPRWSPDSSSLIYYAPGEEPGEPGTIWETPALGGSPRRVVSAIAPGDLSHDGRSIAFFRSENGTIELLIVARDEARERRVATLPNGLYANLRWSPDDKWLAYTYASGGLNFAVNLLVISKSGGAPRVIADEYYLQGIDWLPDGSGFVVSSARGSLMSYPPAYNLWTIPLDGGPSRQLTFGEFSYEFPDVAGEAQVLVSRVRGQSDVWRFPVTGSALENARAGERVTRQTGLLQTVSVSPDETEIVYLSDAGGHANVWVARTVDGVARPITRETDPRVIIAVPVWSPRGDWIAFLSSRNSVGANVTLWLARPDGSDQRDLGIAGAWACWSQDGRWLYYSTQTNSSYVFHKLPVDGGDAMTVRTDDAIGCSSSGEKLYYAKPLVNELGVWDLEVRVATPEDGPSRLIGRVPGIRVPSAAVDFQPVPSPDGAWLAVALRDGSTTNLWALSTDTGEWRQLTDFADRNVVIARRIAWSRDGASLYASVSDIDSDIVMLSGIIDP